MTKALSLDLRRRVVAAVAGGVSCRTAAARFGVAPSTAVKWRRRWRETGAATARPQGGDRRSGRIERGAATILAMVAAEPDIRLVEIAARLEHERAERFAPSTLHRFFARRGITYKKRPATRPSRIVRTSPGRGRPGSTASPRSTPSGSSSSTRPG